MIHAGNRQPACYKPWRKKIGLTPAKQTATMIVLANLKLLRMSDKNFGFEINPNPNDAPTKNHHVWHARVLYNPPLCFEQTTNDTAALKVEVRQTLTLIDYPRRDSNPQPQD